MSSPPRPARTDGLTWPSLPWGTGTESLCRLEAATPAPSACQADVGRAKASESIYGMSVTVEILRNRWSGRQGQVLAAETINRMIRGQALDGLPLSRRDDRFDLRYLWLVSARLIDDPHLAAGTLHLTPTLADVHVADLDLTGSTARLDLDNAGFRNCLLDRAGWQGWQVRASTVMNCSFRRADLRDSAFDVNDPHGPVLQASRSRWAGCDFTRTRTGPYARWGRAIFEGCLFDNTAFSGYAGGPRFFGNSFLDCIFRGRFKTTLTFGPYVPQALPPDAKPLLRNVDFREAHIDDLHITANIDAQSCHHA
jgi:uncharacterized protein YjbI with pentapeptide repeats